MTKKLIFAKGKFGKHTYYVAQDDHNTLFYIDLELYPIDSAYKYSVKFGINCQGTFRSLSDAKKFCNCNALWKG